jgi:hemerythrin-like domain-containing protein
MGRGVIAGHVQDDKFKFGTETNMKITDRFIGDHKTFRKLINDINQVAGKPKDKWDQKKLVRWVELFKDHLVLHAWGEETFFYPAIRSKLPKEGPLVNGPYLDQLDLEHRTVDQYLDRLESEVKKSPISPEWPSTYQTFIVGLTAHIEKEETELFPFSEGLLGKDGLEEISVEIERRRREAPAIRRHSQF